MLKTGVAAAAALTLAGPLSAQGGYLSFDGLTRELRSLANGSPAATLQSIGRSLGGREIWMLQIADPAGPAAETRPALLIVGNLEGDHVVGSHLALETARYLLAGGTDGDVGDLLARNAVYVVPRLNPDGAEAMFARIKSDRRRNARPFDDDNDARLDEDPPEDLNGDGLITLMRKLEAGGDYLVDTADVRLMRKADRAKGESGTHAIYWEGRDTDGDGYFNEDGSGGVDLNRNFQHAYPYYERDAGWHMVSEPESRALMNFVIAHRNIAAMLTYGHSDNLVTAPDSRGSLAAATPLELPGFAEASNADIFDEGVFRAGGGGFFGGDGLDLRGAQPGRDNDPDSGRRPSTTVHRDDLEYFSTVSKAYRDITGITQVGVSREAKGAFFQYGYFQFGVPSFSSPGWALPKAAAPTPAPADSAARADTAARAPAARPGRSDGGGGEPTGDAKILTALEAASIDAFVPWSAFQHPDLGDVEIGGFRPYAATNPPADSLAALGRRHGAFTAKLLGMLPRVRIAESSVVNHGGGVFTVTVEVENAGYFPTGLRHGVVAGAVDATTVQIQVAPEAILTGNDKTSRVQVAGSGGREEFSWVIQGRQGSNVVIRVRSQKGGTATTTVTLR